MKRTFNFHWPIFFFYKFLITGSDEGLEEDDDDDDDADEEEGDISLGEFQFFLFFFLWSSKIKFFIAEVYNDDLEEDNEDWQADGGNFQINNKKKNRFLKKSPKLGTL